MATDTDENGAGAASQQERILFAMINESTYDNLIFARDDMETNYNLKPKNISEVIEILIDHWFVKEDTR